MSKPRDQFCQNCRFADSAITDPAKALRCRRFPPAPRTKMRDGTFCYVRPMGWCGEWAPELYPAYRGGEEVRT